MAEQRHPTFPLFENTRAFVEAALTSEALKARARQMRDDFVRALAGELADAVDHSRDDADAALAAALLASTRSAAFTRAHAELSATGDAEAAKRIFLALIDRGITGTLAALSGTAYVTSGSSQS